MLLREKMRSLASMLILMWTVGLLGVTLRFHPMQMFPSNQVRSRYCVYRSLIWPCNLQISPSIELAYSSKTSTAPPFSFLFFISKYYITSASQTLPSTTFTQGHKSPYHPSNHKRKCYLWDGVNIKAFSWMGCLYGRRELSQAQPCNYNLMGQEETRSIKQGWHEKFGKVELISQPSAPNTIHIRASMQAEETVVHVQWWRTVQRLTKDPISQYIILPISAENDACLACSNPAGKPGLKLQYQWFRSSLQREVKGRREMGHLYSESEMWYLMLVLLRVASFFQGEGCHLGNIHPSNIFLHQHGKFKVFALLSAPREQENGQRIFSSKYEDAFLAPQELPLRQEETQEQQPQSNQINKNKVDLFNIGLVLLSTALLKDCYCLYNRNVFSLNLQKLGQYKEELNSVGALKYRNTLRSFILKFLSIDPENRGLPNYYLSLLLRHERQILNLEEFDPECLFAVKSSPQMVNQIDKTSPSSRAKKYLSLSKQCKDSKKSKQTDISLDKEPLYRPFKIQRKLFGQ